MIDRVKQVMKEKKLSATQFSEEVGIQRSALSHVLSGRNKPSLDFMMKIKNKYPEIELNWLLLGKGKMNVDIREIKSEDKKNAEKDVQSEIDFLKETEAGESVVEEIRSSGVSRALGSTKYGSIQQENFKNIKYILLMYSDDTFKTFTPSK